MFVINKHDELWEDGVTTRNWSDNTTDDSKHVGEQVDVVFTVDRTKNGMDVLNNKIQTEMV